MKEGPPPPVSMMETNLLNQIDAIIPTKRLWLDFLGLVIGDKIDGNRQTKTLDHTLIKTRILPEVKGLLMNIG